jgi:hypothetical protein
VNVGDWVSDNLDSLPGLGSGSVNAAYRFEATPNEKSFEPLGDKVFEGVGWPNDAVL